MKTTLRLTLFLFFTLGLLVGCGKSDSNKNQVVCDAWGNCYNPNQPGGGYPIGGGGFYNPNAIILAGGATVTSPNLWQKAIEGLTGCQGPFDISEFCGWYNDAAPRVDIIFDNYNFTNGTSRGSVAIGNQQFGMRSFLTTWRQINNNTAFEAIILPPYEYRGRFLIVQVSGKSTDAYMPVQLFYGSVASPETRFGDGQVVRQNR